MRLEPVEERQWDGGTRTVLRDLDTTVKYGRAVGAMAWPQGRTPGALVAVVEALHPDPVDGRRALTVAAYETEAEVDRLIEAAGLVLEWAGDARRRSLVGVWVGDVYSPFAVRLRPVAERLEARGGQRLSLRAAPGLNRLVTLADYAPFLDARRQGKRLDLGEFFGLRNMIVEAGVDMARKLTEFPAVAALTWAVAECDTHQAATGWDGARARGVGDTDAGY